MNPPESLMRNPHFSRYFRTWQKNPLSIVFVPLAQICREQGLLQEAREICENGLKHHPHSVGGRMLLARIYYDLDDFENAKATAEQILEEMPAQSEAQSLLEKIQRSPIGATASKPIEGTKSLWENLTMARIYADQGETKIALGIVERILKRNPDNHKALQMREELKP